MATLKIYMEGKKKDLDFLRIRAVGVLDELVAEYDLDETVEIGWEYEE